MVACSCGKKQADPSPDGLLHDDCPPILLSSSPQKDLGRKTMNL